MRRLQTLLAVLAVTLATPAAAVNADVRHRGIAHDALFSVNFDGANALAVGAAGTILRSEDAGESWTTESGVPTEFALNGVALRGEHAVAVGQLGVILRREDDGSWQAVESPTEERLMQVALTVDGRAVAVGAFGSLLVSDDGGRTWESAAPDWSTTTDQGFEPHLYAVDIAENGAVTVAGEFGLILRSPDGHSDWRVLREGEASIFGMHLRPDGVGYAVGQSGTILKTQDGGKTWVATAEPGTVVWLNVRSDDNGQVYVSGIREMAISADAGSTWSRHTGDELGALWLAGLDRSVSAEGSGVVAVGQGGHVLKITP